MRPMIIVRKVRRFSGDAEDTLRVQLIDQDCNHGTEPEIDLTLTSSANRELFDFIRNHAAAIPVE